MQILVWLIIQDALNKERKRQENNIELKLRPYQQEIVDNCREREVIQAATGAGKALPLYTPILTPDGWKAMDDIHVGDTVYDEDGKEREPDPPLNGLPCELHW